MGTSTALIALFLPLASAGAEPEAARLLSRFPAGQLPDTPTVHQALDALTTADDGDSLALLQSIGRYEHGAVQEHARAAEATVARTVLHNLRIADVSTAPDAAQVARWLADGRHSHNGAPQTELRVVAYAVVLTREAGWHSDSIGGLTPKASAELVVRAETLELSGHPGDALPLLIDAFMSGDAEADKALSERGVDTDRLALGLSSPYAHSEGIPRLHQLPVVETSDAEAVTVLLSRAEQGEALPRLAAIENLGVLLRSGRLDATMRKRAQVALNRARADGRASVRSTAESALAFSP